MAKPSEQIMTDLMNMTLGTMEQIYRSVAARQMNPLILREETPYEKKKRLAEPERHEEEIDDLIKEAILG